jgi:hypothetical protein
VLRVQEGEKHRPISDVNAVTTEELDPWMLYLYAMKSPATKEKYLMRLGRFLDFVDPHEVKKQLVRRESKSLCKKRKKWERMGF